MADIVDLVFRRARRGEADAIADLHAESWRRHYRGAYSGSFLDGDVVGDRRSVWRQRLEDTTLDAETVLATDGEGVVGFTHVVFDEDSRWGALIDNLHVRHGHGRSGVGSRLMAEAASAVLERPRTTGLHLWVLEQNEPAQAFYDALGGRRVERGFVMAPGGDPTRLNGTPAKLRYVWEEPELLAGRRGHPTR